MPDSRFHSPCPEIVGPALTVSLATLAPDYFEHAAQHPRGLPLPAPPDPLRV